MTQHSLQHYPHCIREVEGTKGKYTIALPPTSLLYHHQSNSVSPYIRFQDNLYSSMRFLCRTYITIGENPFDHFWNSKLKINRLGSFRIYLNPNLTIHSFQQWHELTQQNPNFMQEQFDPNFAIPRTPSIYFIDQRFFESPPYWLLQKTSPPSHTTCATQPPAIRSIITRNANSSPMLAMLSFPEIALVDYQSEFEFDQFLCLTRTRDDRHVPLTMPHVNAFGITCLGHPGYKPTDPFNYFWNSSFSPTIGFYPIHLNPNFIIPSIETWQELTNQNPNFFQQEFDPDFAESISPIIYTIKKDKNNRCSLSWEFRKS